MLPESDWKEHVAICGMGLRLPSGIHNVNDYWKLLVEGRDARGPVPTSRYNIDGFDDSLGGKSAIKARHGYFLDGDLSAVDTTFFSMTKNEAGKADPQQRMLLEVTRECFEDAGELDYRGRQIACYVGTSGEDWSRMGAKELQNSGGYVMAGHSDLMMANRISYEFDLKGPSLVIKTGCSASLVALHEACNSVRSGGAIAAIVAGTAMNLEPTTTALMTAEGILSPEGSCKTFDASADGFVRAEAITAIYIKRLDRAINDGNPIRAIIRGSGVNSDGRSNGLMQPSGKAHEELMRKCHGTGTATGDPIETNAVGRVFGEQGVYIGSVKPNLGHSEAASGISSVIKAVLSLEHHIVPPNIKFATPNPKIAFGEHRLTVPTSPIEFPKDRAERISVNSFGIGGTNAHVVLEAFQLETRPVKKSTMGLHLLLFSANTPSSLQGCISQYTELARSHRDQIEDLAYTLAMRREKLPHRAFSIMGHDDLTETPALQKVPTVNSEIIIIFSGQGAQWPGMARELVLNDENFAADISRMDQILQKLRIPPKWNIRDELLKSNTASNVHSAEISQPLCAAIQIALFNQLSRLGVKATAVVGHSSGEIAAAYAAGMISMEAAIALAYYRGYVTKSQVYDGAMAAIGLGLDETSDLLTDGVVIACENSPNSTTVSGDRLAVQKMVEGLKESSDVPARLLKVDMAYHSHHMVELGQKYIELVEAEMRDLTTGTVPVATFHSSVSGRVIENPTELGAQYWVDNLVSPVRFSTAVKSALSQIKNATFLELGPHSVLAAPLRQICSSIPQETPYIPTMTRGSNSQISFLSALGRLFQGGVAVDFSSLYPNGRTLGSLPPYPWYHSGSYWHENRVSKAWRFRKYPEHALLGIRLPETLDSEPIWRNVLNLEDEQWLSDHRVHQDVVFPFAGYIAMAGEAIRQISDTKQGYRIRRTTAKTTLVLVEGKPIELLTSLRQVRLTDSEDASWFEFTIQSYNGSTWIRHCEGQIKALDRPERSLWTPEPLPRKVDATRFYERLASIGLNYGPSFRCLSEVTTSTDTQVAFAKVIQPSTHQPNPFAFHPVSIDGSFQAIFFALANGLGRNFNQVLVPTHIEEFDIGYCSESMDVKAWITPGRSGGMNAEFSARGEVVLRRLANNQFNQFARGQLN